MQQLSAGQNFPALRDNSGIRSLPTLLPQLPVLPADAFQSDSSSPGDSSAPCSPASSSCSPSARPSSLHGLKHKLHVKSDTFRSRLLPERRRRLLQLVNRQQGPHRPWHALLRCLFTIWDRPTPPRPTVRVPASLQVQQRSLSVAPNQPNPGLLSSGAPFRPIGFILARPKPRKPPRPPSLLSAAPRAKWS